MGILDANAFSPLAQGHAGTSWGSVFGAIDKAAQGQGQGSTLTARVQDLNDAGLGTDLRRGFNSAVNPFTNLMTFDDRAYANGWVTPFTSKYGKPVTGAAGPGGAISGGGLGATNDNPFDINAPGAGLWAAGYDPNSARDVARLYSDIIMSNKQNQPELARFYKPGQQLGTADLEQFLSAADWYYRDQARQVDQQNKFGDSLIGKLVLGGLTAASGGAFGPVGGALFGAGLGTASSNPWGPLTGALGGLSAGLSANAGGLGNLVSNPSSAFQGSWYLPGGGGGLLGAPIVEGAASTAPGSPFVTSPTGIGGSAGAGLITGPGGGLLSGVPIINGAASTAAGSPFVTSPTGIGGSAGSGLVTGGGVPIIDGSVSAAPGSPMVTSPTGVGGTAGAGILTPAGITHPGILEATGDLIGANGGLLGIAQSGLQGLSLANNISGLLGGASDAPVSGGTTASEWGGKFAKYKSPYKSLPMKRKKGINTQSIA